MASERGRIILVITASPDLAAAVRSALTSFDEVVTVPPKEAAIKLNTGLVPYAALVCDTTTFAADGWDILQWLKWHPTIAQTVPVITLMSPGTSIELPFKVLAKHELPIDPPVLRGLVRGAMTASEAARSSEA